MAPLLHLPFFDLDTLTEERSGKKVAAMFEEDGEAAFRMLEHDCLADIVSREKQMLLACGGGTPCFFDNLQLMKEAGRVVFLNPPLELILSRLGAGGGSISRPLLAGGDTKEKLQKLFEERFPFYSAATMEYRGSDERELAGLLKEMP